MVKSITLGIVLLCVGQFASCQNKKHCRFPKEYFEKYKEILSKGEQKLPFRIDGVYTSKFISGEKTYTVYSFYYPNLVTNIVLPITIKGKFISTEEELEINIKNGFLDDNFTFSYFEVDDNSIKSYSIDEWLEGPVILGYTFPLIIRESIVLNDTTIIEKENARVKKSFLGVSFYERDQSNIYNDSTYRFKLFKVKPNQSNSLFIKRFNNHIKTGSLKYNKLE